MNGLIKTIFTQPPKDTCSFKIHLLGYDSPTSAQMFPYLMYIFVNGAKMLFGSDITPQTMSIEQFDLLKKYMLSLGYKVQHRYEHCGDGNVIIHIWFEPVGCFYTNCKGNSLVKKK